LRAERGKRSSNRAFEEKGKKKQQKKTSSGKQSRKKKGKKPRKPPHGRIIAIETVARLTFALCLTNTNSLRTPPRSGISQEKKKKQSKTKEKKLRQQKEKEGEQTAARVSELRKARWRAKATL